MIKYSVIIPVYNSENTLERCLDSLVCQLRDDIQVILVNDGSTDSSRAIAAEYAGKYPSLQLIDQENSGVSHARNVGLSLACGEYITFLDSDDYLRKDYFATLDRNEDCDLLAFCHNIIGYDPRNMGELFAQLYEMKTDSQRLELLLSSRRIMSPWDKRYKRSIIEKHNIRFLETIRIGEDFAFNMAYASRCQSVGIETAPIIFNDITGQDSLSRKYRTNLLEQMLFAFSESAASVRNGSHAEAQKKQFLMHLDYLYIKNVFSCIAEEFKAKSLHYFRDRKQIISICKSFETPISDGYCNMIHFGLRLLLRCRIYWPFYTVTYWAKGRKYNKTK